MKGGGEKRVRNNDGRARYKDKLHRKNKNIETRVKSRDSGEKEAGGYFQKEKSKTKDERISEKKSCQRSSWDPG